MGTSRGVRALRWSRLFAAWVLSTSHVHAQGSTPLQTQPRAQGSTQGSTQRIAPADSGRVRSGFAVRPDTVMVGDAFALVVSVSVPAGARIEWASIDDTAAVVAMRSPTRVATVPDGTGRRETATYELAAWDVGSLALGVPDATVRIGSSVLKVPLADARVFVQSVLPGDTSLHVPKPAKGLFPRVVPWWERWWPALAVLLGLLLLWWIYRRRNRVKVAKPAPPLDVFARAMHDFDRLERLALADAGERGRAVALAVEIVRVYLQSRAPRAQLSLTSAELLIAVADDARIPHDRLGTLLAEADAIKFARRTVLAARARELGADARGIVEGVEAAEKARLAAEETRRLEALREEQDARRVDEDEARRRSRRKTTAGAA